MKRTETKLEKVLIIEPDVFGDDRGFFMESYTKWKYENFGIDCEFLQDNHSRSQKGVIRGLHFQREPGQAKLIRCTRGRIFDVAVDIRPHSPTFGEWVGVELSEENRLQMYIPVGFAHGFASLDDVNDVQYKCDSYYDPDTEDEIAWDDPDIGIEWPFKAPIISERDRNCQSLKEYLKSVT